jgi:hypothetical protein
VSAFIIVIYALVFILSLQFDYSNRQVASDKALQIAEAGINYYRWHLNEDPDDFQDGTGTNGPYIHNYQDPSGGEIGEFSLTITPPSGASQTVTILLLDTLPNTQGLKEKCRLNMAKWCSQNMRFSITQICGLGVILL